MIAAVVILVIVLAVTLTRNKGNPTPEPTPGPNLPAIYNQYRATISVDAADKSSGYLEFQDPKEPSFG